VLKHRDVEVNWDGVWRLVIFDIPESHKRVRDTLRRRLKEWGFNPWQKSVWATKKPLTDVLRELVKKLEVEDWVLIIESRDVGDKPV
jgi:phenylacetic acid degradation operon negative regulatory protein